MCGPRPLRLDGRARRGTEGAEDAAVARLGPEERMAAGALVEEQARIGRHREPVFVTAHRAAQHGEQFRLRHVAM